MALGYGYYSLSAPAPATRKPKRARRPVPKRSDPSGSVTFVVGLCGSGKSWLMENELPGAEYTWHDGFMAAGVHEQEHRELVRLLRLGKRCAISEPQFMHRYTRDGYAARLRKAVPGVRIRWIFFANDLATANHNCKLRKNKALDRGGKEHIRLNTDWSPYYDIPPRVKARAIYRLPGRK